MSGQDDLAGLDLLVRLARERGLTRIADLGDLPPYGTAEWDEWLEQNPPLMTLVEAEEEVTE